MEDVLERVVVKIGSAVVVRWGRPDRKRIAHIADQVLQLRAKRVQVVLVVSGARACAEGDAGVGQVRLMAAFAEVFKERETRVAQVLLTADSDDHIEHRLLVKDVLEHYLRTSTVPVVNENSVVQPHSFGGNDFLAARVADMLIADRVVILSTLRRSPYGTGGRAAKERALIFLQKREIPTHVVDGRKANCILSSISGGG